MSTKFAHREIDHQALEKHNGLVFLYAHSGALGTDELICQQKIFAATHESPENILGFVESLGYRKFHSGGSSCFDDEQEEHEYDFLGSKKKESTSYKLFKSPNSYCFITINQIPRKNEEVKTTFEILISIAGTNADISQDIEKIGIFAKKIKKEKIKIGEIYTITMTNNSFYFSKLGAEGEEYIKTNYSPEHTEIREYILEQLRSKQPNGRLNIFFGPPGTGKTHFIKSLLGQVESSIFVYVPPHLVPEISNPSLVSAIIDYRTENPNKKIIFVLEDADQVLATRMADNISDINGLLNLTDGFLASSFDIRIIATTNSKAQDMDEAIMRPGRLCTKLNFGPLTREQAEVCFKNLVKDQPFAGDKKEYTLAEIYSLAAESKVPSLSAVSEKSKKSFGF
jgi:SpoVK/Ycf46/Vps4 family AAA+-type ATPase